MPLRTVWNKEDTSLHNRRTLASLELPSTWRQHFDCAGRALLCALLGLAAASGSAKAQGTPANNPGAPTQGLPLQNYPSYISPGDVLSIQVFDTPDFSGNFRVDSDGYITLLVGGGRVKVGGLNQDQAAAAVRQQLVESDMLLPPYAFVSVTVSQYASPGVTVAGEVAHPGTYTLFGKRSLYDVLAIAGGPTADEGSDIKIAHPSHPDSPEVVAVHSANYSEQVQTTMVSPGDTVVVSKADLIYVVGDVGRPGSLPIVNGVPLTVLKVVGLSSGLNRTAAGSRASIIRPHGDGTPETIPVNLDAIMKSKARDITLMGSDILVVPRSGGKVFLEFALPALASSVFSAVTSALIIR